MKFDMYKFDLHEEEGFLTISGHTDNYTHENQKPLAERKTWKEAIDICMWYNKRSPLEKALTNLN